MKTAIGSAVLALALMVAADPAAAAVGEQGYIGVQIKKNDNGDGILVVMVIATSPADMAGVRGTTLGENTTFAGVSTGMVNTVRDGLSVQDGRYANGVGATKVPGARVGVGRVVTKPGNAVAAQNTPASSASSNTSPSTQVRQALLPPVDTRTGVGAGRSGATTGGGAGCW